MICVSHDLLRDGTSLRAKIDINRSEAGVLLFQLTWAPGSKLRKARAARKQQIQ